MRAGPGIIMVFDQVLPKSLYVWRATVGQLRQLRLPPVINDQRQFKLFDQREFLAAIFRLRRFPTQVITNGTFGHAQLTSNRSIRRAFIFQIMQTNYTRCHTLRDKRSWPYSSGYVTFGAGDLVPAIQAAISRRKRMSVESKGVPPG